MVKALINGCPSSQYVVDVVEKPPIAVRRHPSRAPVLQIVECAIAISPGRSFGAVSNEYFTAIF